MKYKIPFLNILYIQLKIYLLSILHISLQTLYNLNFKIRDDHNHYRHISSVHKTYLQIRYSRVLPLQLLAKLICVRQSGYILLGGNFLQTKGRVRRNAYFVS